MNNEQQALPQRAQMIALANRQRKLDKESEEKVIKKVVREVLKDS
jgi:hypothetical protein